MDGYGLLRGACQQCNSCKNYVPPSSGYNCVSCSHKPVQHANLGALMPQTVNNTHSQKSLTQSNNNGPTCKLPGCTLPCYKENGTYFDFCGKSHADSNQQAQYTRTTSKRFSIGAPSTGTTSTTSGLCKLPGCTKPKKPNFEFCGRPHGVLFKAMSNSNPLPSSSKPKCKLPGCTYDALVDGASIHEYCCKSHALDHIAQLKQAGTCIKCAKNPAMDTAQGKLHCSDCYFQEEKISHKNQTTNFSYQPPSSSIPLSSTSPSLSVSFSFQNGTGGVSVDATPPTSSLAATLMSHYLTSSPSSSPPFSPPSPTLVSPTPSPFPSSPLPDGFSHQNVTNYYREPGTDIGVGFLLHSSQKFKDIESQFVQKWLHSDDNPEVLDVLVIIPAKRARENYFTYRNNLEATGNFVAQKRSQGNECRRFHGTARTCTLGLDGNSKLCTQAGCNACNIIRTSFKLDKAAINFGWLRFGNGLYFTSTSSKSHSYNDGSEIEYNGKTTRVMFVAKVALGKGCKLKQDNLSLTEPPAGYDSVLGEVGAGLNYDECVVYKEEAALPGYLIVYSY